jgi:phage terminase small subunit
MNEFVTPRQRKVIESLVATGDVRQAAQTAGVSRTSIYRWMRNPDFHRALKETEAEALANLSRALVRLGEQATQTLQATLADTSLPVGIRVRAAEVVLSRLIQLRETAELESRICVLEAIQHELEKDQQNRNIDQAAGSA